MERKFSSIQISCGWKNIYSSLIDEIGKNRTDDIFRLADLFVQRYSEQFRNVRGLEKMHVASAYTAAALYIPLKMNFGKERALAILDEGAKIESLKKRKMLEKMPGRMFLNLCRVMTKQMFSEKAGFLNEDHSENKKELRFDILYCPYCSTLKKTGCSEVCPIICRQDEYSYKGMKNCIFERTKTLGNGDEKCDFLYRLP